MNWSLSALLVDEKREKIRAEKGRSRIADFFWHSNVDDYRNLRIIVNVVIGLLVCVAVYYMVWKRLNFLEFNFYAALSFQLVFVVASTWAFAASVTFRCAIICVCISALGRTGQGLFSLFILERLSDGPVENIVHNFQLTSSIVICHLEIQSKITAQRISLAAGPVEALLEKHLGSSVSIGQKMIHSLKALIGSFSSDLKTTSEEDDSIASVIDNAQALSDRQFLVEGGGFLANDTNANDSLALNASDFSVSSNVSASDFINGTDGVLNEQQKPIWARYKTSLARGVAHRFVQRCEEMFSSATKNCHEKFENIQSLCYEKTPLIIAFFTCRRMNALSLCQPGMMTSTADKYCEKGMALEGNESISPLTPDLDAQLGDVQNVSREINSQLKLNLHFQAIEEPAREQIRALDEIKTEIQGDVDIFKIVLNTLEDVFSAIMLLLLYRIFRDTLNMIASYLNNLDYRNNFITNDFWYIDGKRRIREKPNFAENPLNDDEIKHYSLIYPFSRPTINEIIGNWLAIFRWLVLFLIVTIVVMLDHYYYRVLMLVVKFGGRSSGDQAAHTSFQGDHTLQIDVKGEGPIAEIIKEILNFKFTKAVHEDLSNEMCLTTPRRPDWAANLVWLIIPLIFMLLIQLVFSFVISRITLLYILSFVFRRRAKARTKHLYRKLLAYREGRALRAEKLGLITSAVKEKKSSLIQSAAATPSAVKNITSLGEGRSTPVTKTSKILDKT